MYGQGIHGVAGNAACSFGGRAAVRSLSPAREHRSCPGLPVAGGSAGLACLGSLSTAAGGHAHAAVAMNTRRSLGSVGAYYRAASPLEPRLVPGLSVQASSRPTTPTRRPEDFAALARGANAYASSVPVMYVQQPAILGMSAAVASPLQARHCCTSPMAGRGLSPQPSFGGYSAAPRSISPQPRSLQQAMPLVSPQWRAASPMAPATTYGSALPRVASPQPTAPAAAAASLAAAASHASSKVPPPIGIGWPGFHTQVALAPTPLRPQGGRAPSPQPQAAVHWPPVQPPRPLLIS